jgi:hypothetical protein
MVDKINPGELAAHYGFALAFMNSNPQLKSIFDKAVKNVWTADRFVAELRGTKWFKHHSANVRNAILQETADPSTYKADVAQMKASVKDAYGTMFGNIPVSDRTVHAWAETAHRMGWSQAQLTDHLVSAVNFNKQMKNTDLGGQAGQLSQQLDQLMTNYGVNNTDTWKASQMKNILSGSDTIEGMTNRIREQAKQQYKAFANEIDGGATVADVASPYMQKMADLLELDPNSLSVSNGLIQKALKATNKQGAPAAMDMGDFANSVRQDSRWQYTDNAKQQAAGVTSNLLNSFGLLA